MGMDRLVAFLLSEPRICSEVGQQEATGRISHPTLAQLETPGIPNDTCASQAAIPRCRQQLFTILPIISD